MSIRKTAFGQGVKRTANVPTAATLFARFKPSAINSFGTLLCYEDNGNGNQNVLQHNGTAATMLTVGASTSAAFGAVATGKWYDAALTYAGSTAGQTLTGYIQQTGSPAAFASGAATTAAVAITPQLWVGESPGTETFSGDLCDIMAWSAVLTAAELEVQRLFAYPVVRLEKLFAWVPAPTPSDLGDYAALGHPFTSTATAVGADPIGIPRLTYARSARALIYAPAGGGGFTAVQRRTFGQIGRVGSRRAA